MLAEHASPGAPTSTVGDSHGHQQEGEQPHAAEAVPGVLTKGALRVGGRVPFFAPWVGVTQGGVDNVHGGVLDQVHDLFGRVDGF